MAKRALLVGCNYPRMDAQLYGCVNDVNSIKDLLKDVFDFQEEDCKTLVDTDKNSMPPTAQNIKDSLKELVQASQSGDQLFVHFSGHGVQLPAGNAADEADKKDEAIVAGDLNLILDDDLREIVKQLQKGVVLTMTTDCCHSGGLLDHKEVLIPVQEDLEVNLASFMTLLGLKPNTKQIDTEALGNNKLRNRSYPVDSYMRALANKAGMKVENSNPVEMLASAFGENVSCKFRQYADVAETLIAEAGQVTQEVQRKGCLVTLLGFLGFAPKDSKKSVPTPGEKPPKKDQLGEDVGVLITGCQSDEKSADASISGNKNTAGGAMTRALVNVVRKHHEENPDRAITNKELVLAMRQTLDKAGFKQTPSLEGSAQNADKGFVTGVKKA